MTTSNEEITARSPSGVAVISEAATARLTLSRVGAVTCQATATPGRTRRRLLLPSRYPAHVSTARLLLS
jgi:hypothetical protein